MIPALPDLLSFRGRVKQGKIVTLAPTDVAFPILRGIFLRECYRACRETGVVIRRWKDADAGRPVQIETESEQSLVCITQNCSMKILGGIPRQWQAFFATGYNFANARGGAVFERDPEDARNVRTERDSFGRVPPARPRALTRLWGIWLVSGLHGVVRR